MRLSSGERSKLFNQAKRIHESLGSLFQNPMDITVQDVIQELHAITEVEALLSRYTRMLKELDVNDKDRS